MYFFTTIFCIKYLKYHYINLTLISYFLLKKKVGKIYTQKIKNIYDTRISEFNYKFLNNPCDAKASFLNDCKYRSSDKSNIYNDIEDIKHLLHYYTVFDCMHVQYVWKTLSVVLSYIILSCKIVDSN